MQPSETLDPVSSGIQAKDDSQSKAVKTYLKVIHRFNQQKEKRDNKNRLIRESIKRATDVMNPEFPNALASRFLMQALEKVIQRLKPLDYTIHGTDMPAEVEDIVTMGIGTVLDRGGFMHMLRDKGGFFQTSSTYGDAFGMLAVDGDDKEAPIKFMTLANSAVYVDPFATVMRSACDGRAASKVVVIMSYPYAKFCEEFPEWEGKVSTGVIPRKETNQEKRIDRSCDQELEIHEDEEIEVAYGYDISNLNYTIFAGSTCTILKECNGEKGENSYPFFLNGEPYIPVPHFMCRPSYEGFYNIGAGDLLYTIGELRQKLLNMGAKHAIDNILPTEIVNLPKAEYGQFFMKLAMAEEMKAQGKRPYVPVEYDTTGGGAQVSTQTMATQNNIAELQIILAELDKEAQRLGFNLDEIDRGANVTASQIIAEEEGQNAFVKQAMEYNASETQFIIEVAMDLIKKIPKTNKVPLNLTTKIEWKGQKVDVSGMTLGDLAETLRNGNWFVRVNARSGANSSNVFKQAQLTRGIQAAVGTPAELKLRKEFLLSNDIDVSDEDMGIGAPVQGMPQQPNQSVPTESLDVPMPSQTDRLVVSPNAARRQQSAL